MGSLKPVGERIYYAVNDAKGDWFSMLVFCAAVPTFGANSWVGHG